jgi:hypothetical protein
MLVAIGLAICLIHLAVGRKNWFLFASDRGGDVA